MKFAVVSFFNPLALSEAENLSESQPDSWLDSKIIFFTWFWCFSIHIIMWMIILILNHNAEEVVWWRHKRLTSGIIIGGHKKFDNTAVPIFLVHCRHRFWHHTFLYYAPFPGEYYVILLWLRKYCHITHVVQNKEKENEKWKGRKGNENNCRVSREKALFWFETIPKGEYQSKSDVSESHFFNLETKMTTRIPKVAIFPWIQTWTALNITIFPNITSFFQSNKRRSQVRF